MVTRWHSVFPIKAEATTLGSIACASGHMMKRSKFPFLWRPPRCAAWIQKPHEMSRDCSMRLISIAVGYSRRQIESILVIAEAHTRWRPGT